MMSKNIHAKFAIHTYIVCLLCIRRLHLYIYYYNIVVLPAFFYFVFVLVTLKIPEYFYVIL